MEHRSRIKGILLVLAGSTLWGVSGTAAQYLFQKEGYTTQWLVAIRLLISGILLLGYTGLIARKDIWSIWRRDRTPLLTFSIVGMLGVQFTYFSAVRHGNAATATILQYLSPVMITAYLSLRNRRLPGIRELSAVALAVLGTFLMITGGRLDTVTVTGLALFWGIASAITSAFYTLQPKRMLMAHGSLIVVGWAMLVGGIAISCIYPPWHFTGNVSSAAIGAVAFVVLFGTLIAFCCYLESLKHIPPTQASVLSSAEPLSAAFLSVVWLGVPLEGAQWAGIAGVIVAIWILTVRKTHSGVKAETVS